MNQHVNRRAIVAAGSSVAMAPALATLMTVHAESAAALAEDGATSGAAMTSQSLEHPWERARRLAGELAQCLAEGDDGFGSGPGGKWFAEIYPASKREFCVCFGSISSREWPNSNVSLPMQKVIDDHKAALAALENFTDKTDSVALGHKPSKAAERRWSQASRSETKALSTLCAAKPHGRADARAKLEYMEQLAKARLLDDIGQPNVLALVRSAVSS
jgi:hypothetical protein